MLLEVMNYKYLCTVGVISFKNMSELRIIWCTFLYNRLKDTVRSYSLKFVRKKNDNFHYIDNRSHVHITSQRT